MVVREKSSVWIFISVMDTKRVWMLRGWRGSAKRRGDKHKQSLSAPYPCSWGAAAWLLRLGAQAPKGHEGSWRGAYLASLCLAEAWASNSAGITCPPLAPNLLPPHVSLRRPSEQTLCDWWGLGRLGPALLPPLNSHGGCFVFIYIIPENLQSKQN